MESADLETADAAFVAAWTRTKAERRASYLAGFAILVVPAVNGHIPILGVAILT